MASGDTKLSICSDALIMLGEAPLASFDSSDASVVCDRLYEDIKVTTLAMYPWSFTLTKQKLTKASTSPVNEYKNQFRLPSDVYRISGVKAVFNSEQAGAAPMQGGWEILGDVLITNQEIIVIDYQRDVDESKLPKYFVQLLKYQLAWHFAETVTDQITKADYWRTIALGTTQENNRGGFFRTASNIDGSSKQNEVIQDFSLIQVRR